MLSIFKIFSERSSNKKWNSFLFNAGSIIDITGSYYHTTKPKTNEEAFQLDAINIAQDFDKSLLIVKNHMKENQLSLDFHE